MEKENDSFSEINLIIKKVISEINIGKSNIFKIVDSLRDDFEDKKEELKKIKELMNETIKEVDKLQRLDKSMRNALVITSKNFHSESGKFLKEVYEETVEIRVKYLIKQKEEKELRLRRDSLERTLKNYLKNIEDADNVVNQINVALGYLEGSVEKNDNFLKEDSPILIGIKILKNQESDRKRIAREIHDGPAQYLANSLMRIDFCKKVLRNDLDRGLEELDDLKFNVQKALKEVRGILFDLRPVALEQLGLERGLKDMVRNVSNNSNINIKIDIGIIKDDVENIVQIAVYRLIQEILNNIEKHSKAENVFIIFKHTKENIIFMVKDDGIGFDVKKTIKVIKKNGTSYGLLGILDRVNQFRGAINIKSSKGEGTTYIIKLPANRRVMIYDRK